MLELSQTQLSLYGKQYKNGIFKEYFLNKVGLGIPKLYVKFWWPLIFASLK